MPDHCDDILRGVSDVVEALGGTNAAARKVGIGPPAVANWIANDCFPPARFIAIDTELRKLGKTADPALFRKHRRRGLREMQPKDKKNSVQPALMGEHS